MRFSTRAAFLSLALVLGIPVIPASAAVISVAKDNADSAAYAPQPNNNWSAINGNSVDAGYNTWTVLGNSQTNSRYMEGVGVNGRQVDGNFSFGLIATNNFSGVSRPLATAITGFGHFEILMRFDLTGAGTNGFSLRAGNGTNTFNDGQVLAVGIFGGDTLAVQDASGTHPIQDSSSVSNLWKVAIDYNTLTRAYNGALMSTNPVLGGFMTNTLFSGLFSTNVNQSVGSFAVVNSSTGRFVFDAMEFSVPEPAVFSMVAVAIGGLVFWRRGRTESEVKP